MSDSKPDDLLPLPTAVFHILIALADRDRHGYAIMLDIATRTDGAVQLSAATLYSSIRRMLEQGLIEELRESPDPSSTDERRRYYHLARFGRVLRQYSDRSRFTHADVPSAERTRRLASG